jgi:hypothetical protein
MIFCVRFANRNNIFLPSQVFPFPVYPSLHVHVYVPGPVSAHVANSLQSSCGVPHILISVESNANRKAVHNITYSCINFVT